MQFQYLMNKIYVIQSVVDNSALCLFKYSHFGLITVSYLWWLLYKADYVIYIIQESDHKTDSWVVGFFYF